MPGPQHQNHFAVKQDVLYRQRTDEHWREGTIVGIAIDERTTRHTENGPIRANTHAENCDEFMYVIAPEEYYTLPKGEGDTVTECQCDVKIVDADSTGRWHGQRLHSPEELALLLFDFERRCEDLHLRKRYAEVPGDEYTRVLFHHGEHEQAWAMEDDLVAWASGMPFSTRKKKEADTE